MPQARRKTPFSGKAKKQQLQSKKKNKTLLTTTSSGTSAYDVLSLNYQPSRSRGGRDTNRYALKFYRESDEELKMKKEDALKALNPVPEKAMEVDPSDYFPEELSFPKRPPWDFNMTPAQLDAQEQKYFRIFVCQRHRDTDSSVDDRSPAQHQQTIRNALHRDGEKTASKNQPQCLSPAITENSIFHTSNYLPKNRSSELGRSLQLE